MISRWQGDPEDQAITQKDGELEDQVRDLKEITIKRCFEGFVTEPWNKFQEKRQKWMNVRVGMNEEPREVVSIVNEHAKEMHMFVKTNNLQNATRAEEGVWLLHSS